VLSGSWTFRGHLVAAGLAGEVRLADQFPQRAGDLPGPDRTRVDLGGGVKISQEMRGTQLVDQPGERGRVVVLVAVVHLIGERYTQRLKAGAAELARAIHQTDG
jgi:hypothetical protein